MRREAIVEEPVLEQRPDRRHRVLPADLLPLGHGAPVIADRHLVEPDVPLRQLGRQLRLDAEAIAVQRRLLEDVGPDGLVAGLHVRQVDVVEDVGHPGQEVVRDPVPVEQDLPLPRGRRTAIRTRRRPCPRGSARPARDSRPGRTPGPRPGSGRCRRACARSRSGSPRPFPMLRGWRTTRIRESFAARASRISGDPSRLPSSTQISSIGRRTGLASTRATIVRSVRASL